MEMVTLFCAIVGEGEGSIVPVEIEADKSVGILKDRITEKAKYSFASHKLNLYLAKKNGKKDGDWMKDDDVDLVQLQDATISKDMEMKYLKNELLLKPTWSIKKYFTGVPTEEVIHVLVDIREGAIGVASETSATAKMIKDIHDQLVQSKRKRYVHSNVGSRSSKGRELLQDLNIHVKPVHTMPFAAGDHIPAEVFEWESVCDGRGQNIALTEEQQRERYRAYVEENIGVVLAEKELCVVGVEKGQDILTVLVPGHDIELAGRTDLLVLSDLVKEDPSNLQFLPGVKMLIEVKRAVKPGSVFQALSELIALDLLVNDPVMALLTDLTNNWQFFWVSEMCDTHINIHKATITEPGEAFGVIRTLLAQDSNVNTDVRLPCFEEPVKRRKLAKMLPIISEGGESGGIRAAIERYFDIASVLGPDIDMARATANQIVRSIPVFSYYT